MKPVQNQEQEQQQNQIGCEPPPRFEIWLEIPAPSATSGEIRPGKLPKLTTTLRAELLALLG
jgi:hypothetical protein